MHRRSGRGAILVRIAGLAALVVLLSGAADEAQAPHGALGMDAQKAAFAKLINLDNPAKSPPGVDPYIWKAVIVPSDNAMTTERVALGHDLYFDMRLSADGSVSCATCHDVSRGFTDQRSVSEGINAQLGKRNAPTTMNALLFQTQFLDGRVPSLEEQAKLPILNPVEMGQPSPEAAMQAVNAIPEYRERFQRAYGRAPNYADVGRAIAAFERTLVFLDAPFDRYLAGDSTAISEQAQEGFALFNGKARCVSCHMISPSNPLGTDNRFHNIGVSARHQDFEALAAKALDALGEGGSDLEAVDQLAISTDMSELGRFMVTKDKSDIGAFKTSQLRNIALTAPYMHDGSMKTLWDVMDHYNKGGEANPYLDGGIEPLDLNNAEINALVAFLFTLTDDRFADQNRAALQAQLEIAAKQRPFRDEALAQRKMLPFEERVNGGPLGGQQ